MSNHPNTILLCTLTPHGLSRKTMREILAEAGVEDGSDNDIKIGSKGYNHRVMESNYDDDYQLAAPEGSLLFFDYVTYGYGEDVLWGKLERQKNELEEWAKKVCENHKCDYKISVTANYW